MRPDIHIFIYREAELVPLAFNTVQLMRVAKVRFDVVSAKVFVAGIVAWMLLHV